MKIVEYLNGLKQKERKKRNMKYAQYAKCRSADRVEPSRQWRGTFQLFGSNMSSCASSSQSQREASASERRVYKDWVTRLLREHPVSSCHKVVTVSL